jgi:hypothetical protein
MTKTPLLATGLATLALGLAACGGSSSPSASGPKGPATVTVAAGGGQISVPGDGPVSTLIMIDRTALAGDDRALAIAYKNAALQTAAPTIARGGQLSLRVFGRVSGHALSVYSIKIPTPADVGPAARDDAGQTATLAAALDVAVGLAEPQNDVAAQALARVTDGSGSDIGRVVGQTINQMSGDPASVRVALVETDGWIEQAGQPTLKQTLAQRSPKVAAAQIVRTARAEQHGSRRISLLRMVGLGYTAGKPDPDSGLLDELDATWQDTCEQLAVDQCDISSQA